VPQNPEKKRDFILNDYLTIEDPEGIDKAKEIAFERIEKILAFAKPK
jgi:hypothetical protein